MESGAYRDSPVGSAPLNGNLQLMVVYLFWGFAIGLATLLEEAAHHWRDRTQGGHAAHDKLKWDCLAMHSRPEK